jgi:hypothetical protein
MKNYFLKLLILSFYATFSFAQNAPKTIPEKPVKSSFDTPAAYENALFEWYKTYNPQMKAAYSQYKPDTEYNGYTDEQLKKMTNEEVRIVMGNPPTEYVPSTSTSEAKPDGEVQPKPMQTIQYTDEQLKKMSETERQKALGIVLSPQPKANEVPASKAKSQEKPAKDGQKHRYSKAEYDSLPEHLKQEVIEHPERFEVY